MPIWKVEELKKELYESLKSQWDGCIGNIDVTSYQDDGSMGYFEVTVGFFGNFAISDLPKGFQKGDPDSDYIMSILNKRMSWEEFRKVSNELSGKGYHLSWKEYFKDVLTGLQPVTEDMKWQLAPKEFIYEIVSADRHI